MPIDQIRIDNWPEPEGNGSKYTHTTTSGPFNGLILTTQARSHSRGIGVSLPLSGS